MGNIVRLSLNGGAGDTVSDQTDALKDYSGHSHHGTAVGGVSDLNYVEAKRGKGIKFNGKDQAVEIPHSTDFELTEATIALWVKISRLGNPAQSIFAKNKLRRNYGDLKLMVDETGILSLDIEDNTATPVTINLKSTVEMEIDTWVYIVCVFSGNTMTLYLDGVENKTEEWISPIGLWHPSKNIGNTNDFVLGKNNGEETGGKTAPAADNWFDGVIDNFMMWNRQLSPDEILELYDRE